MADDNARNEIDYYRQLRELRDQKKAAVDKCELLINKGQRALEEAHNLLASVNRHFDDKIEELKSRKDSLC